MYNKSDVLSSPNKNDHDIWSGSSYCCWSIPVTKELLSQLLRFMAFIKGFLVCPHATLIEDKNAFCLLNRFPSTLLLSVCLPPLSFGKINITAITYVYEYNQTNAKLTKIVIYLQPRTSCLLAKYFLCYYSETQIPDLCCHRSSQMTKCVSLSQGQNWEKNVHFHTLDSVATASVLL